MNALNHNTFHGRLHVEGETRVSDGSPRLARSAVTAVGALLTAYLLFVAATMPKQGTRPDVGSFAPAVPAFENQFDPLELDLNASPRSSVVALVDIPFDPLLP